MKNRKVYFFKICKSLKQIGTKLKNQILCRNKKNAKSVEENTVIMELVTPRERSSARLKSARLEFAKEMNKSLADESRLDDLLDAIIFAEQEVLHFERESFRKFLINKKSSRKSSIQKTRQLSIPTVTIPQDNHICVNSNALKSSN